LSSDGGNSGKYFERLNPFKLMGLSRLIVFANIRPTMQKNTYGKKIEKGEDSSDAENTYNILF